MKLRGWWRRKLEAAAAVERISPRQAARSPKIWLPRLPESSRWCGAGCLIERLFYSDKKMQQMRLVFLYSCPID